MKKTTTTDHRPRVAASRRAKMRRRLIESAVLVFAEKGVDASIIDDVILTAGVARGTFYNYFNSNKELLIAVNEELANELLTLVEAQVVVIDDPALRVATGILLFLEAAHQYPLLARFVYRVGFEAAGPGNLIYEFLPPHISEGINKGRFLDMPLACALDLIAGIALVAVFRISTATDGPLHAAHAVSAILRGLGMNAKDARELAHIQTNKLMPPEDSLLVRSHLQLLLNKA